jgi:hypothetical protein
MAETKEQLAAKSHITELEVTSASIYNSRKLVCSCGYKEFLTYSLDYNTLFKIARAEHANNVLAFHLGVVLA